MRRARFAIPRAAIFPSPAILLVFPAALRLLLATFLLFLVTPLLFQASPLALSTALAGENTVFWLEATPVAGSIGVAWRAGDRVFAGVEGGGGVPQFDVTFRPGDRDFLGIIHLGGVVRFVESRRLYLELGPQAGIGDLDNDPRSGDDMPNLYAGFSAAFMFGGRRWRLGPGLDLVWIFDEPDPSIFVANLNPLALRVEW